MTSLALLLVSLLGDLAPQSAIASSRATYTAWALPRFQAELEKRGAAATVTAPEPLTLHVVGADKYESTIALDRMWALCEKNAGACESASLEYLTNSAQQIAVSLKGETKPTPAQLRLYARDATYVANLRKQSAELVAWPLAGSLWLVAAIDLPTSSRLLVKGDLAALAADEGKVRATASANVTAQLGGVDKLVPTLPPKGLGYLAPAGYYNSGLLANAAAWSELARKLGGQLLVSVPTDQVVLFADGGNAKAVAALALLTQQMYDEAQRSVSTQILRWSDSGWKPYTP